MKLSVVIATLLISIGALCHGQIDSWEETFAVVLKEPLWNSETAYDASHFLMVPLHAAYWLDRKDLQKDFDEHFRRLLLDIINLPSGLKGRLIRLQYLFFSSRYLVLAGKAAPKELEEFLLREVAAFWQKEPAWQWGRGPFSGGVRERLAWKIGTDRTTPSYYRAVIDEELFLIGIAANLQTYLRHEGRSIPKDVQDVLQISERIFRQEVRWNSERSWLFQPGVWSEHPDYSYAGQERITPDMKPNLVKDIAMDSSHSTRFPLLLLSLAESYPEGSVEERRYRALQKGLAVQFFNHVVVPSDSNFQFYRLRNYMDGRNGLYRFNYSKAMRGRGYESFSLSGTPLIGWWIFLPDKRVAALYANYALRFPEISAWLATIDPYGKKAWMYRKHYPEVLPQIVLLCSKLSNVGD